MARRPSMTEMNKVDLLQKQLRRIDKQLGYMAIPGSNGVKFEVFGSPLGRISPGSRYKKLEVTGENLLKEMENLAGHYKISPHRIYTGSCGDVSPKPWMVEEAAAFWMLASKGAVDTGVHKFGKDISIPVDGKKEYKTKEQLIWVSKSSVEAFSYLPVDPSNNLYRNDNARYPAAMDYNRSMYFYIEQQGKSPSKAIHDLRIVNKKLHMALFMEFFKGHNALPDFISDWLSGK